MTLIRVWDKEFTLLRSFEGGNLSEVMRQAEDFITGSAITEPPHYTIDPAGRHGSWRQRTGGRIVRTETGFDWQDNRSHLEHLLHTPNPRYTLPNPPGPGDKVTVEIGGQVHTDTIESIRTTTPTYASPPRPTRWQRLLRVITPRRWRKQHLWIPPGGTASTVITIIGDGPVYQLGKDILPGKLTTWPEIVAEMANSEPDEPKTT